MIKRVVLSGLMVGLAALTGCAENGESRDTGIGAESGRLIGSEVGGRSTWLGGHVGAMVGRQTEKGVAESAASQQKPAAREE